MKNSYLKTQRGSILFVSLILLMVLAVLSYAMFDLQTLEQKMSSYTQDKILAQQAADAAITAAKAWLANQCFKPESNVQCTSCNYNGANTCKTNTSVCVYSSNVLSTTPALRDWSKAMDVTTTRYGYPISSPNPGSTLGTVFTLPGETAPLQTPSSTYFIEETLWDYNNGNQHYLITARGLGVLPNTVVYTTATYVKHTPLQNQTTINSTQYAPGNVVRLFNVGDTMYRWGSGTGSAAVPPTAAVQVGTATTSTAAITTTNYLNPSMIWAICVMDNNQITFKEHDYNGSSGSYVPAPSRTTRFNMATVSLDAIWVAGAVAINPCFTEANVNDSNLDEPNTYVGDHYSTNTPGCASASVDSIWFTIEYSHMDTSDGYPVYLLKSPTNSYWNASSGTNPYGILANTLPSDAFATSNFWKLIPITTGAGTTLRAEVVTDTTSLAHSRNTGP